MNAIAKNDVGRFQDGYRALSRSIAQTLPSHISAERFERATMVAVQRNPDLLAKADRKSLFLSLQRAAQDGLLPDGREGAIVLFGNQATWMPMVAGIMKLARNSGEIASINSQVAYRGERFRVVLGDEERIEHERNLDLADNAEPIAVYAVATLKNGEKLREVMTWGQVQKVRAVSRSKSNGPWVTWPEEMMRKSVIRRLSKRLPMSTDRPEESRLQAAIERQDDVIDGTFDPVDAATEASGGTAPGGKLDALEHASMDQPEAERVDTADRVSFDEPDRGNEQYSPTPEDQAHQDAGTIFAALAKCKTPKHIGDMQAPKALGDVIDALKAFPAIHEQVMARIEARRLEMLTGPSKAVAQDDVFPGDRA